MNLFGFQEAPPPLEPKAADETQLAYLYRLIEERLATRLESASWYRRTNFLAQMATTVLSALITVIAGLKSWWFTPVGLTSGTATAAASDVVLFLSAVVTVVAAAGAFYSPRELWVVDSVNAGKLRALRAKLQFHERAPDFDAMRQELVDTGFLEYQAICDDYNAEWLKIRSKAR
ncbi:hypothetical protein SRS16CHR_04312 [Variovorax sp. SRS16]|uniref:SLATT domain-containing protein n=1 Tax=Variovorax sp. SRS16 TaxID=282217 RepID=UPI001317FDA9|nr:SLATT domain-containing protein [Variovorax sp. SRS16]VTU28668.1 hypothetical protein SRS16CHR_04312 [Variovorax sp. SRS16]